MTRSVRHEHAQVTLRVPFAASSVAVARQHLKQWMAQQGCDLEVIEDGRIVISEMVGNSVRHARPLPDGTLLVAWAPDDRGLRISVSDGGSPTRPHKVNASSSALAGRGMAIIENLALTWWDERKSSRTTVNAVLDIS